jgi:hypothetical protein
VRPGGFGKGTTFSRAVPKKSLLATFTSATRIPLLALFFVSVVDFSLDSARFDLVVMTAALVILLWGGLRSP